MREFKLAKGWGIFIWIVAPVIILIFAGLLISPLLPSLGMDVSKQAYWFLGPLSLVMIAVMVLGLLDAIKGKFVIGEGEVYLVSITGNRHLKFDEIKGYTLNEGYIFIVPAIATKKKIKISKYFSGNREIVAWLSSRYPDLDTLTQEQEREEILNDEQFGATTEIRAEKLARASKTAKILNGVALLVGAWTLFLPNPYKLTIIASILVPIIAFVVFKQEKGLIRIDERKGSGYPTVFFAVCVPAIALVLRALLDYNIFNLQNVWLPVAFIVVIIMAVLTTVSNQLSFKNRKSYPTILGISLIIIAYAYGSVITINCAFDLSKPEMFQATILDKRVSSGKTTTYYFKLTPWGSQREIEEVTVSKALFNQLDEGAEVRIAFEKGRFGIPWFVVTQ